jgi:hypothetical protein
MRSSIRWIAVVGAVIGMTGLAMAQPPGGGRGQGRGGMMGGARGASPQMLLNNEDVQKELKFTDKQKEDAKAFAPAAGGRGRGQGGGGGGGNGQGGGRQRGQGQGQGGQQSEQAQAAEKFVKESLSADQQKRFKQIRWQVMGLAAYGEEDVQTALKFTDDQKSKIKTLLDDYNKDVRELMPQRGNGGGGGGGGGGNVDFQEIQQKREALTKTYTEKVQGALTDDQKKAWKDLIGAEFKLQRRAPADR